MEEDQYDDQYNHNYEDHNDDDQEASVPWRNNLSRSDVVWIDNFIVTTYPHTQDDSSDHNDGHDDNDDLDDHDDDDQEANVPWRNNLSRSDVVWHGKRSPPRKYKFAASEVVPTAEQSGSFSANCENW